MLYFSLVFIIFIDHILFLYFIAFYFVILLFVFLGSGPESKAHVQLPKAQTYFLRPIFRPQL